MSPISRRAFLGAAAGCVLAPASAVRADEAKVDVQENIRRGLEWLAKNQNKPTATGRPTAASTRSP